jgi:hypothetical protein
MRQFAVIFATLIFTLPLWAVAPVLFYTDLDSGPKTGGENNQGVYVTVYGRNFGGAQGGSTLTLGGVNVIVKSWCAACNPTNGPASDMIVFQPGVATASGSALDIVLTTSGGSSTLTGAFTVRSGNIYFVDASAANDSGSGSLASPKKLIQSGYNLMTAGDTLYVKSGTYSADNGFGFGA